MGAELINLRQVRKRKKRKDDAAQADQNRITHGRTKQEREQTGALNALAEKRWQVGRRDREDDER